VLQYQRNKKKVEIYNIPNIFFAILHNVCRIGVDVNTLQTHVNTFQNILCTINPEEQDPLAA
jgi:hypothetical protein